MYCTTCGSRNDDRAGRCFSCGNILPSFDQPSTPPPAKMANYLVPAILATVCCCLPFGIPAIVFAVQANTKLGAGDTAGALDASKKARLWTWLAFGGGIMIAIGYGLLGLLSALSGRG